MILFEHGSPLIGPTNNQVGVGRSMNVLGFTFDCDLKWHLQTENVIRKTKRVLFGLKHIRPLLNRQEFSKVITSHAFSILYYGIWNCGSRFFLTEIKQGSDLSTTEYFVSWNAIPGTSYRDACLMNGQNEPHQISGPTTALRSPSSTLSTPVSLPAYTIV